MDALTRALAHSTATPPRPVATLEALLDAWRARRLIELIAPIETLSAKLDARIAPGRPQTEAGDEHRAHVAWVLRAASANVLDVPTLVAGLFEPPRGDRLQVRIEWLLGAWADDLRVARAFARLIESPPVVKSATTWSRLFASLRQNPDPQLRAALERRLVTPPARDSSFWARHLHRCLGLLEVLPAPPVASALEQTQLEAIAEAIASLTPRAPLDLPASPRDPLLEAILAEPDAPERRAVWADALLDRGDPRGEFVSLQLARATDPASRARGPSGRERLLFKHGWRGWLGPLACAVVPHTVEFEAGLPTKLQVALPNQWQTGPWSALARAPALATVTELDTNALEFAMQHPRPDLLRRLGGVDLARLVSALRESRQTWGLEVLGPCQASYHDISAELRRDLPEVAEQLPRLREIWMRRVTERYLEWIPPLLSDELGLALQRVRIDGGWGRGPWRTYTDLFARARHLERLDAEYAGFCVVFERERAPRAYARLSRISAYQLERDPNPFMDPGFASECERTLTVLLRPGATLEGRTRDTLLAKSNLHACRVEVEVEPALELAAHALGEHVSRTNGRRSSTSGPAPPASQRRLGLGSSDLVRDDPLTAIAYAHDGATLFALDVDLIGLDLEDRRPSWRVAAPTHGPYAPRIVLTAFAEAPSGRAIAVGSSSGAVAIWERRSQREQAWACGHRQPVSRVAFVDDARILSLDRRGDLILWHLEAEALRPALRLARLARDFAVDGAGTLAVLARSGRVQLRRVDGLEHVELAAALPPALRREAIELRWDDGRLVLERRARASFVLEPQRGGLRQLEAPPELLRELETPRGPRRVGLSDGRLTIDAGERRLATLSPVRDAALVAVHPRGLELAVVEGRTIRRRSLVDGARLRDLFA